MISDRLKGRAFLLPPCLAQLLGFSYQKDINGTLFYKDNISFYYSVVLNYRWFLRGMDRVDIWRFYENFCFLHLPQANPVQYTLDEALPLLVRYFQNKYL